MIQILLLNKGRQKYISSLLLIVDWPMMCKTSSLCALEDPNFYILLLLISYWSNDKLPTSYFIYTYSAVVTAHIWTITRTSLQWTNSLVMQLSKRYTQKKSTKILAFFPAPLQLKWKCTFPNLEKSHYVKAAWYLVMYCNSCGSS